MVSDAGEQLHYGLVQPGGYTPFRSLQPEDRRHMFNVERANMVAMGSARYMGAIEAQNHGVSHGDDTDMMESEGEGGESEERERDPPIEPRANLSQTIETFRNELNSCLMRSDYGGKSISKLHYDDSGCNGWSHPNASFKEGGTFHNFEQLLGIYGGSKSVPSIQLWQTDTIAMVDCCAKWRTWTENLHVFPEWEIFFYKGACQECALAVSLFCDR